jgi:predicted transport protein
MPLFSISSQWLTAVEQTNFSAEKDLQSLVEKNIQTVFNCRLVASEFPTGAQHAGRIDTLALSEDHNPVIVEYKKVESSDLINQSLYYLSWIHDHRGDFEIAVQRTLGSSVKVDWSDVRVICIAPHYKKYDLHAVQVMQANIELWTYRLFKNQTIYFEEVLQISPSSSGTAGSEGKSPVMISAGKKAALTRKTASYSFEQHLKDRSEKIQDLIMAVHDFVIGLDPAIEVAPKKFYIAYKSSQNIVCMETFSKNKLTLFLKLKPKEVPNPPKISRDVSRIGHYGTGDFELTLKTLQDLEVAKPFIEMAYQKVGG